MNFLLRLFKKEKHNIGVIRFGDNLVIPGREYFKDEKDIILLENYKKHYLEMLKNRTVVTTPYFNYKSLKEQMNMYIVLLLGLVMDNNNFCEYAPEELLVQIAKLKMYYDEMIVLKNEIILRLIALKEIKKEKRIPRHNKMALEEEINSLSVILEMFIYREAGINIEIKNYFDVLTTRDLSEVDESLLNERLTRNGIWKDAIDIPDEYIENYNIYIILESLDGKYVTNINYISEKCSKLEIYLKAIRNYSRIFSDNMEIKRVNEDEKLFFVDSDSKYIDITEDVIKDLDIFAKSGFLGRELEDDFNNSNKIKIDKNMYFDIYEDNSINLTAEELINMYEKDQKNSDKSLLFGLDDYIIEDEDISYDDLSENPEINLSGYIEEVFKSDEMHTLVKICSYDSKYSINCYFKEDNYYYLESLDKGSLIVANRGQLEREGNVLGLYRCELSNIQLTVEELVNAYEEDFLYADKLYRHKQILISGEVERINIVHKRKVFVYLKTDSKNYIIECYFAFEEDFDYLSNLKKGDILKMSTGRLLRRKNILRVSDCTIFKN